MLAALRAHPAFGARGTGSYVLTSYALGIVLGGGVLFALLGPRGAADFGLFAGALAFFHFSEFLFNALYHANTVSWNAFLLNHSHEYGIAMAAAFLEFWLEWAFVPWLKGSFLRWLGLAVTLAGQAIRLLALFTAQKAFTLEIAQHKRDDHKLVTEGIYKHIRHPGYMGWFYWTVGTQVLLANPVCTVAFAVVTWGFFRRRIQFEEETLVEFFGEDYKQYRSRTPTMIPFIK